jgi:hypothetical protein
VPGAQSLILELVDAAASVTAATPITAVELPKDESGAEASTLTGSPLAHAVALHVCSAVPTVVNVPSGYSTLVVGTPELLNNTHTLASIMPLPLREI